MKWHEKMKCPGMKYRGTTMKLSWLIQIVPVTIFALNQIFSLDWQSLLNNFGHDTSCNHKLCHSDIPRGDPRILIFGLPTVARRGVKPILYRSEILRKIKKKTGNSGEIRPIIPVFSFNYKFSANEGFVCEKVTPYSIQYWQYSYSVDIHDGDSVE